MKYDEMEMITYQTANNELKNNLSMYFKGSMEVIDTLPSSLLDSR
jgi:hypothetical protein